MANTINSEQAPTASASPGEGGRDARAAQAATAFFLMQEYGPVMDGAALAKVLHYPTLTALERSLQRGHLKIKTLDLPGRRGTFVHAYELARYLSTRMSDSVDSQSGSPLGGPENHVMKKEGRKK